MKRITHLKPLSLFHLLLPQLVTAWAVFGASWLFGLGGARELAPAMGAALGGDGLFLSFAALIPANTLAGVLGLAAFAALYNRYNRGPMALEVELSPTEGDAWLLGEVSPSSIRSLFVPLLAPAAVNTAWALGILHLLGLDAALTGEAGLEALLVNWLFGTLITAGITMLLGMLAAAIYNRVAAGGDGIRLHLSKTGEDFVLRRFGLASLVYALPSFFALVVLAVIGELILGTVMGGGSVADAIFSVGAALPALWLVPFIYNRLRGRSGIAFRLQKANTPPTRDVG